MRYTLAVMAAVWLAAGTGCHCINVPPAVTKVMKSPPPQLATRCPPKQEKQASYAAKQASYAAQQAAYCPECQPMMGGMCPPEMYGYGGHPGMLGQTYNPYGLILPATTQPIARVPHGYLDNPQQPGPPTATYAYPYYTTRGPRDFLINNPPTIGY